MMEKGIPSRIEFLDNLRGIAVAAVVLSHFLWQPSKNWASFTFGLGYFGFTLFFLVSGFIIPASLQQKASLGSFWTNRFFRLFPSYWVSIAITYPFVSASHSVLFFNMTMLQGFFGYSNITPVYWTLTVELAFYSITSVLFLWGLTHRTVEMAIAMVLFAIALGMTHALPFKVHYSLIRGIAVCTVGTVIYQTYCRRVHVNTLILTIIIAFAMELLSDTLRWNSVCNGIGGVMAYCLFFICMRRNFTSRILSFLAKISYPLYLTHLTVLAAVPQISNPVIYEAVLLLLSVVFAVVVHYFVEAPLMQKGKLYGLRFQPGFASEKP